MVELVSQCNAIITRVFLNVLLLELCDEMTFKHNLLYDMCGTHIVIVGLALTFSFLIFCLCLCQNASASIPLVRNFQVRNQLSPICM